MSPENNKPLIINGLQLGCDVSDEIMSSIKSGQKIGAIKLLMESTDLGLKEAKDYIEDLSKQFPGEKKTRRGFFSRKD